MLARTFRWELYTGTRRRLSQFSCGAMIHVIKLNVPPVFDQVSSRSLLRVTIVVSSVVGPDRSWKRMFITSSNGVDFNRVIKSLTVAPESLSLHVKEVKFERGSLMIGVGEIESNERSCREGACPPRKLWGKRTAPAVLPTKLRLGTPSNSRR